MNINKELQTNISGDETPHFSVILDCSLSMYIRWEPIISELSNFLLKQKENFPGATYDIITFNTDVKCYKINGAISSFQGLSPDDICPDGLTALYNAIIITCKKLDTINIGVRKFVVIVTDGEDNRSDKGSQQVAYNIIDKLKKNSVEFFFLGAEIDSFKEANKIGIPYATNISLEDGHQGNIRNTMRSLSDNICRLIRTCTTTNEHPELLRAYSEPMNVNAPMDNVIPVLQRCNAGNYGDLFPSNPCILMNHNSGFNDSVDPLPDNTNSDDYITVDINNKFNKM